jgi:hypothetical protein
MDKRDSLKMFFWVKLLISIRQNIKTILSNYLKMKEYFIPLIFYLITAPIINWLFKDYTIALIVKFLVVVILLALFRKAYPLKFRISWESIFAGIFIFIVWVGLEGRYPQLGGSSANVPLGIIQTSLRVVILIVLAPIIEEYFTRYFLNRYLQKAKWQRVPIGKFTVFSFIFTVLFFGFAHSQWLPGLIAGITLNILLMRRKNIHECITAHAIANACLAAYILYTGSTAFW